MRWTSASAVILSLAGSLASSGDVAAQPASVEQALLQVERDWEQASVKHDQGALERVLAPEFVSTDSDGLMQTRAEMARRHPADLEVLAFSHDDYKVHVFGDAAVVTGRASMTAAQNGRRFSTQERFTDVFVRRDGRWQAVSSHSSRVAKP